jgi:hypothetical protein
MKIKMIFSKSRRKNSIWKAFRKGKTKFEVENWIKNARNIDFQGSEHVGAVEIRNDLKNKSEKPASTHWRTLDNAEEPPTR